MRDLKPQAGKKAEPSSNSRLQRFQDFGSSSIVVAFTGVDLRISASYVLSICPGIPVESGLCKNLFPT